ncbi:hypothetical protein GCM10020227_67930 [Streptomyces flavovirens]
MDTGEHRRLSPCGCPDTRMCMPGRRPPRIYSGVADKDADQRKYVENTRTYYYLEAAGARTLGFFPSTPR